MAQEQGLLGGRYRLVVTVGRGGMGTVWRAHDEVLDRDVAIKEVLLPHGLGDADRQVLYQRTFREARASARLSHPNVVTVHDVVEEDGRPWIVMEYVPARSLQDIIDDDGPVDARTAADMGRQTLIALRHAHSAGILHRDVKPSNVLITGEGRAVLTDFGIAQMEGDANLTQTGLVMGSPAYIPPERAKGERAVPASDLWALGATLYAAVEGKAPYERSDAIAALAASLTEPVPPPRNAGPLAPVLDGLLVREPHARMTADEALPLLTRIAREHARAGADPDPAGPSAERTRLDHASAWAGPTQIDRPQPAGVGAGASPAPPAPPVSPPPAPPVSPPPVSPPADDATMVAQGGPYGFGPQRSDHARQQDAYMRHWQEAGVEPTQGQGRTGPSRPAAGRRALIAVAVIVILVAAAGGALLLRSQLGSAKAESQGTDKTADSRTGTTTGASQGTDGSKPITSPKVKPAADVKRYDEDGFSVAAPAGWARSVGRNSVLWRSPDEKSLLQIDQTEWYGPPRPQAEQADRKGSTNSKFPGYQRLAVTDLKYLGQPAAQWDFTFTDPATGVPQRVVDRWVHANGRPYAIYFRVPVSDWAAAQPRLQAVFDSFRPR